jgi:hypothetical protein
MARNGKICSALDIESRGSLASEEEEVEVAGKRLSMRKTREVLRPDFELKLGQREVCPECPGQPEYGARLSGSLCCQRAELVAAGRGRRG